MSGTGEFMGLILFLDCRHYDVMKTLTMRGLPAEVHARLKKRAKANRHSLNQEVITELAELAREAEVEERKKRVVQVLGSIKRFRTGLKQTLSVEEIRAAIEEGRD